LRDKGFRHDSAPPPDSEFAGGAGQSISYQFHREFLIGAAPAQGIAKYCIYYDDVNDWFQDKIGLASQLGAVQSFIEAEVGKETDPNLAKAIAGNLDPVGGNFFKKTVPWAYMDIEGQKSLLDDQSLLNIKDALDLAGVLADIAVNGAASSQILRDPHSWDNYIANHAQEIVRWIA